ncbi:uncharacterized protein TNIN_166961 [Trichonephila inaurata madagascariensis]|uniref:Uncharacterized protein n=1 Tax=Trichonephila inaurata madagascariensis TaxID=2747483 RepID=A0A8X7C932_9ARAC|nr:uncharacterized protein TNIN_166961 [Trichonephila inaurata madagascariensis]
MAADNSILEVELKNQLEDLKQTLHMKGVKTLSRKQYGLLKLLTQRKQIRLLENQIKELEPTVTMLYSPQHVLKDNQIKGYLVYLLQLKEFFSREVETKKEIIRQREDQVRPWLNIVMQLQWEKQFFCSAL